MKTYKKLDAIQFVKMLSSIDVGKIPYVKLKRGDEWISFLEIYCGFDIETTTICDHCYMYIWQMSFKIKGGETYVIKDRTWDKFEMVYDCLVEHLSLRSTTRMIMWIANLGYEFQFMRARFQMENVFAKTGRQPIYAYSSGIEFRDALAISQGSLEYLAKSWTETQKMKGDLDYLKRRNSKTPLTEKEEQYCDNDVVILSEFSEKIFKDYIKAQRYIPLTATGILRHDTRKKAIEESGMSKEALYEYIKSLFPESEIDYRYIMEYLFRGGFVHANYKYVGEELHNLHSSDFKSSYPACAFLQFPVTPFVQCKNMKMLPNALETKHVIMNVTFYGLEATTEHSIESQSKCIKLELGPRGVVDNGRVHRAKKMQVLLTELDFKSYKLFYRWKKMKVNAYFIADKGDLPKYLLDQFYFWYKEKETIDKKKYPQEYAISKTRVNGMYGLNVTRLVFRNCVYRDELDEIWGYDDNTQTYDQMIEGQVLSPYWGIYISAWARHRELLLLSKIPNVVYSDTDSHKYFDSPEATRVLNEWNEQQIKYNQVIATKYGYDFNVIKNLGCMELETSPEEHGIIKRFKTLGAKRYICEYENDGFISTISGLNKKILNIFCEENHIDPFEVFDHEMCIPSEIIIEKDGVKKVLNHKLTPIYIDVPTSDLVIDEFGNEEVMEEYSSVYLKPTEFHMTLDKDFMEMVNDLAFALDRKKRFG